jgi:hypothetical protein
MGFISDLLNKQRRNQRLGSISTDIPFTQTKNRAKPIKKKRKAMVTRRPNGYYGRGQGGGGGLGLGRGGHLNSPSLAHKAVYGKEPSTYLRGRTTHPQKMWNGIPVDKELKSSWLKKINSIKGIEVRGSCAGHDKDRVSYVTFRLDEKRDKEAKKIAKELSKKKDIYAIADVGAEGRPRIVVATKKWHGKKGWSSWWQKLPDNIDSVVNKK